MAILALILLGSAGLLAGFFALFMHYLGRTAERVAGGPHNDGIEIYDSGLAPPRWGGRRPGSDPARRPRLRKRRALRRLSRSIRYFAHTPLVDDDSHRRRIVARLEQVRAEWRGKSWAEIHPWR